MSNLTNNDIKILESIFPYILNYYMGGYSLEDSIKMGFYEAQLLLKELIDCETERSIEYRERIKNKVLNEIMMK